jgi:nucleoside-diphosphate-sugar epimerase
MIPAMTGSTHPRLFCFGFGVSAAALARRLAPEGFAVAGTTRDREKAETMLTRGIEAFPFDGESPLGDGALDDATHVLVSIPPDQAGDPVLRQARRALEEARPLWIGYLSTTGVYGNRDGGRVDEGSALRPTSERAHRRVQAELAWLRFGEESGLPVHAFRLAGIYGPGRSVLDDLRAGRARRIDKPGHVFSRVHVDDIAAVLAASIAHPRAGAIYNVCDDEPAEPRAVVEYAAGLLGISPPPLTPFDPAALSDMARSFWADCKRVDNSRIKRELGVVLRYPDYRAGLEAIRAAGG